LLRFSLYLLLWAVEFSQTEELGERRNFSASSTFPYRPDSQSPWRWHGMKHAHSSCQSEVTAEATPATGCPRGAPAEVTPRAEHTAKPAFLVEDRKFMRNLKYAAMDYCEILQISEDCIPDFFFFSQGHQLRQRERTRREEEDKKEGEMTRGQLASRPNNVTISSSRRRTYIHDSVR
jgi:hypothetical protein